VDNPGTLGVVNRAKAGSAIPVKFSLGGYKGGASQIFVGGAPGSVPIISGSANVSDIEQISTAGASGLSYDAGADQYIYVWKTEKSWGGTSRRLYVTLLDGTQKYADFNFTK